MFITGENLQQFCQISLGTTKMFNFNKNIKKKISEYIIINDQKDITKLNIDKINKYQVIFVYGDFLPFFFDHIFQHLNKFILVSHNADNGVFIDYIKYLDKDKIIKWYGLNIHFEHPKLIALPIGIANSQWKHGNTTLLQQIIKQNNIKEKLLYINFSEKTNKNIRTPIMNLFKNKNIGTFSKKVSQDEYLTELSQHKFCISPPGNGIDCHRTWECIYLGVIPIIQNHIHNIQFDHLPVLLINDWNIITEEYLLKMYKEFKFKQFSLEKININYWKEIIYKMI